MPVVPAKYNDEGTLDCAVTLVTTSASMPEPSTVSTISSGSEEIDCLISSLLQETDNKVIIERNAKNFFISISFLVIYDGVPESVVVPQGVMEVDAFIGTAGSPVRLIEMLFI